MPEKTGSQCFSCSDRKVRERREAFCRGQPNGAHKRRCWQRIHTSMASGCQQSWLWTLHSRCSWTCSPVSVHQDLSGYVWSQGPQKLAHGGAQAGYLRHLSSTKAWLSAGRAHWPLPLWRKGRHCLCIEAVGHCLATHPPGCPVLGGPLRPVSAQYKQRRCMRPATAPAHSPPSRRGDRMGPEVHCSVQAKEVDHAAGSLLYFPQSVGLGLGPQAGQPEECAEHHAPVLCRARATSCDLDRQWRPVRHCYRPSTLQCYRCTAPYDPTRAPSVEWAHRKIQPPPGSHAPWQQGWTPYSGDRVESTPLAWAWPFSGAVVEIAASCHQQVASCPCEKGITRWETHPFGSGMAEFLRRPALG